MAATRMSYPAPRRDWYQTGEGWSSRAWTEQEVNTAKAGGAWFVKAHHDFADRAAALAAGVRDD